ncbi:MAG: thioredoxin-dependent thiol peroxidase [Alphaproteobacteria bacterium]|nr:thioredoxin-dependent thiol peroxidase [Alphaproteobacteria bacterium]
MTLNVGNPAPHFILPSDGNSTINLSNFLGKKIILYFYPKDDTPGCTREACNFRDYAFDFEALNAIIFGVSKDTVKSHDKFKAKYNLPFHLLSDENTKVCQTYGVWTEKSLYGKKYMGIERTTFLIDIHGIIRHKWQNVKIDQHVEQVLEAARSLK